MKRVAGLALGVSLAIASWSLQAASIPLASATIADIDIDAAFKAGTLTSERLVKMYLARIDAYNDRDAGVELGSQCR